MKQGEESQAGRRRVGRDRPDDPDPGEGRHLRGDGEGVRSRGEERRRGVRRDSPYDPEPGVGRHTRGNDGEGEVKKGEESQAGRRRVNLPSVNHFTKKTD